jgi:hypothetical protein
MPPDAIVSDGPATGVWSGDSLGEAAASRSEIAAAALREAALRQEVARLTRERNRLLGPGGAFAPQVAERRADPASPSLRARASDAARLAAKDALIRGLYQSRSWRAAAPLRAIAALFGRGAAPTLEAALASTDAAVATPDGSVATPAMPPCLRQRPEGRSRGDVLVVAPHLPLFDRQSGGLRLKSLIGLIASLGWRVTFCASCPADFGPGVLAEPQGRAAYEGVLRDVGVVRFVYGIDGIRTFLIEAGGEMRYAFIGFPDVALETIPIVRAHCPWARVIFDTVDLHFLRLEREAVLRADAGCLREAGRLRQIEMACLRSADVTIAVSEDERRILLDLAPEAVVETLPNVFRVPADLPPGPEGRHGLLFVGGFWHVPNGDAVLWFVEQVWPLVRAQAPDLVFRIAGADPTPEVLALGQLPGVEVLGHLPDLAPLFDRSRVFVAPLRFGAGMKGKVGQSLVHGLPVVATPVGAEGMGLEDGRHLLVAETAEDFADRVLALLRDDALWARLQRDGRALIQATLSEDAVARRLEALFHV